MARPSRRDRLLVVGSLNLDLVGRAPRIPGPGETVLGTTLARHHGGKGGNQAVAAARLGAAVRFVGAVGSDAAGDELRAALVAESIDTAGIVRVEGASGTALITVSDAGENAITVLPGANVRVAPPAAGTATAALGDAGALLLQLEIPAAVNLAWARAAREAGVPVLLNAAPADAAAATMLLPWVDLLLVNEHELARLIPLAPRTRSAGPGDGEAGLGPPVIVTTLGPAGCRLWQHGRSVAVPGHAVPVVDTTGAGDTFAGALAAALVAGRALTTAVSEANRAAALACGRAGARGGMPTRAELDAALAADATGS